MRAADLAARSILAQCRRHHYRGPSRAPTQCRQTAYRHPSIQATHRSWRHLSRLHPTRRTQASSRRTYRWPGSKPIRWWSRLGSAWPGSSWVSPSASPLAAASAKSSAFSGRGPWSHNRQSANATRRVLRDLYRNLWLPSRRPFRFHRSIVGRSEDHKLNCVRGIS